ncbi:MAG TPA: TolC family protein [Polyangiales bacterium]|nr:TolC family protein [Polyangiales bacterium]
MKPFLALALWLLASHAHAQPLALDERSVVKLALAEHPAVDAARAEQRAADASYRGGKWGMVPNVQVTARYTRLSDIPARYRTFGDAVFPLLLNNVGVRADLAIPVSDLVLGLAANLRALGETARANEIEITNARAQVAYEARIAFLAYWRGKLALDTNAELVHAADSQLRDQRTREAAGTVARNDVLTFEVALDSALMREHAARAELAQAEASLRAFFPSLASRELVVPTLADEELRTQALAPKPELGPSPRIAALEAQAAAASERASAASLDRLPKLSLVGGFEVAAPNPRVFVQDRLLFIPSWDVGVRLEWSLSQLTVGGATADRERAQHQALVARVEEARRKLHAERSGALRELELVHARVERSLLHVQHATALTAARRGELETGTTLPVNVVLAETDLAQAKNALVQAVVERALALAKLDFVQGRTEPTLAHNGGKL